MEITGQKIVVLDDDACIREIMSYILEEQGYAVTALAQGEELLTTIREVAPDLLLMDIRLGAMDGRIICSELKLQQETSTLPVILISGADNLAGTLLQNGPPDDVIAKPFAIEEVLQKVAFQLTCP